MILITAWDLSLLRTSIIERVEILHPSQCRIQYEILVLAYKALSGHYYHFMRSSQYHITQIEMYPRMQGYLLSLKSQKVPELSILKFLYSGNKFQFCSRGQTKLKGSLTDKAYS